MSDSDTCYLERVEISDFRAFGEGFSLALPPGPGVTLVCGPNGLGKTTFFDAIEWCLTGDVQRFRGHRRGAAARNEQHLTRLGAKVPNSHRVSLYFTGADPLDRGAGSEPADTDVIALLKRPGWTEVSDLASYLSLTHFLGQSAAERFSVKPPEDQWEALQGPAGVDRVNFIRERLGGQAARTAFTRQIRDADDDVSAAQRALADARTLVQALRRARSIAQVREAVSPEQLFEECTQLVASLAVPWSPERVVLDRNGTPEGWLELAGGLARAARVRAEAQSASAGGLEALVSEIEALRAEQTALTDIVTERSSERVACATELGQIALSLEDAHAQAESSRADLAAANTRVATCDRLFAAAADAELGTARAAHARERIAMTERRLEELQSSHSRLLRERDALSRRAADRDAAAREAHQLREATLQAAEVEQSITDAQRGLAGIDGPATLESLAARASALEARTRALGAEVRALEEELAAMDRRADALSSLAEQLRAMLSAEDLQCPVCATAFASGELLARARAAAAPVGSPSAVGARLAAATTELEAAVREAEAVSTERRRVEAHLQALLQAVQSRDDLLATVRRVRPDAEVQTFDDVRSLAETAERVAAAARFAAPDERNEADVQRDVREREAERARLIEDRAALRAELSEAERALDGARLRVAELARDLGLAAESSAAAAEERLRALRDVASRTPLVDRADEELHRLQRAQRELTARDREAERSSEVARRKAAELNERLGELLERWAASGATGDASLAAAWHLRDDAEQAERRVQEVEERLRRLVDAYTSWREDADRTTLEARLDEQCRLASVHDESALEAAKLAAVHEAEARAARMREAQRTALQIADKLKDEAERFAQGVLQPLNATIRSYSRALMVSADDSLYYRALFRANRSEFRSGVVRRNADGQVVTLDRDPNLYFSEGQLSALSVSALFAASTTFRWSRWPALLLDDPLQHNDVIHASAFIDLLRRLVQKLEYQVVLSTHDSDEAEFIARKCEGAGVPFQMCRLRAAHAEGVISTQ